MTTIPNQTSARVNAGQAQFSTADYGRVGDQRPYQVVQPAYDAPQFLKTFMNLQDGLRECLTMCALKGKPFRLVRWGSKNPCIPCNQKILDNRLPHLVMRSRGALGGYPEAKPVAEAHPDRGVTVFGPDGGESRPGEARYRVSDIPWIGREAPTEFYVPGPINKRYLEAVKTAQFLAGRAGKRTFVCSSFGASCKSKNPKKWVPVVYAEPGGIVARYPHEENFGGGTVPGSTSVTTNVSPQAFRELLAESRGATFLGQGY